MHFLARPYPDFFKALLGILLFSSMFGCNPSASSSSDTKPPLPGPQFHSEAPPQENLESADSREPRLAQAIAHLLSNQHLVGLKLDDALSKKSYTQFLQHLDRSKLFLLQSDIDSLSQFSNDFDNEIMSGHLRIAHQASQLLSERFKKTSVIIETHLQKPFDFKIKEFRETDSDKLSYAKNDQEMSERWRRTLKLETLGRVERMESRLESLEKAIAKSRKEHRKKKPSEKKDSQKKIDSLVKALAKIPKSPMQRIQKAQEDLQKSYNARFKRLSDVDPLDPAATFLNAITASFDPHTVYMPPAAQENFDIQMTGSLEGIGAVLVEEEHFIGVRDIVPGGASWKQGELESGDLILSVTQDGKEPVDIGDMKIDKVVKMIRGPKGTKVSLTVEKDNGDIKTIAIVRDKVIMEDSYARGAILQRKNQSSIGYIYLPSFYGDTRRGNPLARYSAKDVKKLLEQFTAQNLPGVIIDMRSNGGGLLDDARVMTGLFIEEGPIVQTQLPNGEIEVLRDQDPSVSYDGKVVVLIDRFSASAAEILAAALQDYGRAIIVGPGPTHGKGTVQALLDLNRANLSPTDPPMGVLKLTIQQFFRVTGSSTQRRGVSPDIAFPDSFKHIKTGERNLDNALPWREIKNVPFTPWVAKGWDKATLRQKSFARQSKSTYFINIEKRANIFKQRQDDTQMPLEQSAYHDKLKSQRDELEALSPEKDSDKSKDAKSSELFSVKILKYAKQKPAPKQGKRRESKDKIKAWSTALAGDASVEESLRIIEDMISP